MSPRLPQAMQAGALRPGRAVIVLLVLNVVAYVIELILLRAQVPIDQHLFLTPSKVFEDGEIWQPATYVLFHSQTSPWHLLGNMLFLWMFGSPLESWWGSKRLVVAYVVSAAAGGAFTLLFALLTRTPVLGWLLPDFWTKAHVGASGAVMGLTVAWGIVFSDVEMQFLFLGRMKGRTFMWIIIGVELLVALSFDTTSSTSHFGGMIGAAILCKGLWRPSRWAEVFRRAQLKRSRKKIERELKLLDGGKKDDLPN